MKEQEVYDTIETYIAEKKDKKILLHLLHAQLLQWNLHAADVGKSSLSIPIYMQTVFSKKICP